MKTTTAHTASMSMSASVEARSIIDILTSGNILRVDHADGTVSIRIVDDHNTRMWLHLEMLDELHRLKNAIVDAHFDLLADHSEADR